MDRENIKKIIELRHRLHAHPELSLHEEGTIGILTDFLRDNTTLEVVRRDGWFYAVKKGTSDEPPIAFRADMDALPMDEWVNLPYGSETPGIAHKCGHDGHSAVLCGVAMELSSREIPRTAYLIFQPAEENGLGGSVCSYLIEEKGISEVYAFHNLSGYPERKVVYRRGLTQPASEGLTIRLHGKQSHASAPEEGRNPAEAIAQIAMITKNLVQEISREGARKSGAEPEMILCTIVGMEVGTGDFGISAGEGSIRMTLRAEREMQMKLLEKRLIGFARVLAEQDGLDVEYKISDYFPETRNHDDALQKVISCAERLGMDSMEMKEMWRASEDFGHYLKKCSGAMFYIGNGVNYPALHTREYDFNDGILATAVELIVELAE